MVMEYFKEKKIKVIKGNERKIILMEKVYFYGGMVKYIKGNLVKGKDKGMELWNGRMVECIKDNGNKENSMELQLIVVRIKKKKSVNGIMEKKLNGNKNEFFIQNYYLY